MLLDGVSRTERCLLLLIFFVLRLKMQLRMYACIGHCSPVAALRKTTLPVEAMPEAMADEASAEVLRFDR